MTLTYDDNGNLTDDGIFKFVYDAWNRLVKVQRRPEPTETKSLVATYAYDGANRRNSKVVANCGVETYPNDGGNTTVHFYYDLGWRIVETRNGSNQATWQHLWGTQYIDELIWLERNGDPTVGNDTDPDGTAGEGGESPGDHRYCAQQDRNWNVAFVTDYGGGVNGPTVERFMYLAHGQTDIALDDTGSSLPVSHIGVIFRWQALAFDSESRQANSRNRRHLPDCMRFSTRDPLGLVLGMNPYEYLQSNWVVGNDALGLQKEWPPSPYNPANHVPSPSKQVVDDIFEINVDVGNDIVDMGYTIYNYAPGHPVHP